MTFKPMTYLVSFTLFVVLFMGLGGYFGYGKIADHFLVQAYLDARALDARVQADPQGHLLRWEEAVSLPQGRSAQITARNRPVPVSIRYLEGPGAAAAETAIPLGATERTEDLRIDAAHRYLYVRVFTPSPIPSKEATWLCKYDLLQRAEVRRASVNPILLPAPFRP